MAHASTNLSAIRDLFNNEIVAWQLSKRKDVKLVLDTIDRWTRKRDVSEAVLHSDQGSRNVSLMPFFFCVDLAADNLCMYPRNEVSGVLISWEMARIKAV
jgi:transposase InsO family protein